ncbi:SLAP domain-containing protein [Oceanobacillus sp. 1P07AA]|uniref:SLAP domain-containing protein n=1 Tax=Oceanobacillus sp. 1P07AA TaxID=3132293 RepID=UPI0039A52986
MSQTLKFESSWDKALPEQDRLMIKQVFGQINHETAEQTTTFTPLWQAQNYKGELLVTVVINNYSEDELTFDQAPINYIEDGQVLATHFFTLKTVIIPPKTSMPWAFIYPVENISPQATLNNGVLSWA